MARNLMDILNDAHKAMELSTQKALTGPPREAYALPGCCTICGTNHHECQDHPFTELEGHRCTSDCRRIGCEDVEAHQRRAEMLADNYEEFDRSACADTSDREDYEEIR